MTDPSPSAHWTATSTRYRLAVVMAATVRWVVLAVLGVLVLVVGPVIATALGVPLTLPVVVAFAPAVLSALAVYSGVATWLATSRIRYQLLDDEIGFRSGLLSRTQVALPYGRIQTVTIHNSVYDRLFGISNVVCQSAADQVSVTLPGLRDEVAESTRLLILERAKAAAIRSSGL